MKKKSGAIILAAGNSTRMGQCKFLLPALNGNSFIEELIRAYSILGIEKIVIVTQEHVINRMQTVIDKVAKNRTKLLVNPYPELERFYSLQLGIKALGEVEYSFVQNADSPRVQLSTLNKLIEHREFADFVYPECLSQKGHPVLINKATLEYLVKCPSCAILKEVLWKNKGLKVEVDDKSVTMDIDTPEDYKQFLVSGR